MARMKNFDNARMRKKMFSLSREAYICLDRYRKAYPDVNFSALVSELIVKKLESFISLQEIYMLELERIEKAANDEKRKIGILISNATRIEELKKKMIE